MFGLRDRAALAVTAPPDGADSAPDGALPHQRLLARQLAVHCRFRFGVVVLIVTGTTFAQQLVGIVGLPVGELLCTAAGIAVLNLGVRSALQWLRQLTPPSRAQAWLLRLRHGTIVADYLALGVLVHLVGGARSPFLPAFLLHIMLGSLMVSRRAAWAYAALASLQVNVVVFGELSGVWVPVLPLGAVPAYGPLDARYAISVAVAYTFLFVVTTALLTTLADALRRMERELVAKNAELAQLSAARRDFLHVALHNLKSPLAAVTMLLNNLGLELAGPLQPKQRELIDRARQRIAGSDHFLRDLALLASLEASELAGLDDRVELCALLLRLAEDHRELADARSQRIEVELPSSAGWVRGSERLLAEAIANLLTNAIKFSPRGGRVRLALALESGTASVVVEDEGPGIAPEHRSRLFREFARLDTVLPDGERPAGTGLGLSIVDRILRALGGQVDVVSEVGRGSKFRVRLPLAPTPVVGALPPPVAPPAPRSIPSADALERARPASAPLVSNSGPAAGQPASAPPGVR